MHKPPQAIDSIFQLKSIEQINSIGDLFDLQMEITKHLEQASHKEACIKSFAFEMIQQLEQHFKNHQDKNNQDAVLSRDLLQIAFDCAKDHKTITREILEKLETYRTKNYPDGLRQLALLFLAEHHPQHTINHLIDIARDPTESSSMRNAALQRIQHISAANGTRSLLLDIIRRNETAHIADVITLIEKQHRQFDCQETKAVLEDLVHCTEASSTLRCRAIKALGLFGDLNTLERLYLLSENDAAIQNSILEMVRLILTHPIDVLTIRPENFEHLIKKLLLQLGYYDVTVTRSSGDGGVDVIAYKKHHGIHNKPYKTIVQCKRYAPANKVDLNVVEKLIEAIQTHQAKEGLLIITSTFSERATVFAQHHQYIELVDGAALQGLLNQAFGEDRYYISNILNSI